MISLPSKGLSFGEIFSYSREVYTNRFKEILFVTLAIYVPMNTILFSLSYSGLIVTDSMAYFRTIQLLEAIFGVIATMAISLIVHNTIFEETELTFSKALEEAASNWFTAIGTNIIYGVSIFIFTLLLIIPGLIWSVFYVFAIQVVVLKNKSGLEALAYSKQVVKGYWWKVFFTLFCFVTIELIFRVSIGFIEGLFLSGILTSLEILLDTIGDILSAFFTVGATILFINLDNIQTENTTEEKMYLDSNTGINPGRDNHIT